MASYRLSKIVLGAAVLTLVTLGAAAAPAVFSLPSGLGQAQPAATACARVATTRSGDSLVNTCAICRDVKVRRTRAGEGLPTMRDYKILSKSSVDLSFKGPGQTQIVSDLPCDGEDEAKADGLTCIQMVSPVGKSPVLANTCDACRTAKIETRATSGNNARQIYTIKGKTYVPVPWLQQGSMRIVADQPC